MARSSFKYVIDLGLWSVAGPLGFLLRLDSSRWAIYAPAMAVYTAAAFLIKAVLIIAFGLNRSAWRRFAVQDLSTLLKAVSLASLVLLAAGFIVVREAPALVFPRSIPILDGLLAMVLLGGIRVAVRQEQHWKLTRQHGKAARRILIVGTGDAAIMAAHDMLDFPQAQMKPIGFIDDTSNSRQNRYYDRPVLGKTTDLPRIIQRYRIDEVIIALPNTSGAAIRAIMEMCRPNATRCRILPGLQETNRGYFSLSNIRDIQVEDLLGRAKISLNLSTTQDYLRDRVVLITGAGGSIGSEIVRQVARCNPERIILFGRGENSLVSIERELAQAHPEISSVTIIGLTQDRAKMEYVFQHYRPEIVFHAAANKHVPLMEHNEDEAVFTNVGGARNVIELALAYNVEVFVNISSDKAVRPTSVMGATKRVTEHLVNLAARRARPHQAFVSARFGNVLGSRGSVVPFFLQQIRAGGPVTVTHPEMTRYFMTIPEATQLVLRAASLHENGMVYVLDMGQPIKIVDLARDVIRLAGLEPGVDIDITYTGIRPGERLTEELLTSEEDLAATYLDQVMIAKQLPLDEETVMCLVDRLLAASSRRDTNCIRTTLMELVPTYLPSISG